MSRTYGPKYAGWQSAAQISKQIRADIKDAIQAGDLPGTTRNYSVRSDTYSMGQAVRVHATLPDDLWRECDGTTEHGAACGAWAHDHPEHGPHRVLTAEGERVRKLLDQIHRAYNHDGSDSMTDYFDVLYSGSVDIR